MSSRIVRIIGVLGILWSLVGVGSYLAHVGLFGAEAAAPPPGVTPMPDAITAAFAIAVFSGVAGSIGLALLKRWAAPVLWLSFIASAIDWGWVLAYGNAGELPLGIAVMVISLILAIVATRLRRAAAGAA